MPLKDEDKSLIVAKLRKALLKCTPPMVIARQSENGMELMGNKPVPYGYDKKIVPGMYFSAFVVRKDMVSFYFMPMYMAEGFKELIPGMIKTLKGKTCFNIKKPEQVIEKELNALLKRGVVAWEKQGYMK